MSDDVKRGVLLVFYGKYYGSMDFHEHDSIYKHVHAVDIIIIFMSPAIIHFMIIAQLPLRLPMPYFPLTNIIHSWCLATKNIYF